MMEVSGSYQAPEKLNDGENGFVWQDYLDASESFEVPQIMFPHVELTLQSGIEIGMSLEVPASREATESDSYWVATIVMACGPLLRLRYFGGDDRALEFWFNLTKEAAHELGWCVRNNKKLQPPESVLQRTPDCLEKLSEYLVTARSVPQEMLTGEGLSMTDRIKQGMKVEVSDLQHPYKLWVATIIENVGGRLLLRYDTPAGTRVKDFWMFCTTEHLHGHGFVSESDSRWFLEPPSSIVETHTYEEWKEVTELCPKSWEGGAKLFGHEVEHPRHRFRIGMKLEAIVPSNRTRFAPATIIKIFDEIYFLVQIDNHDEQYGKNGTSGRRGDKDHTSRFNQIVEKNTWLCTADHPYIFPVGWAKSHGLRLAKPRGWSYENDQFDWDTYLRETQSSAAPDDAFAKRESAIEAGYEAGMRLEAVDPRDENIICAAHIAKVMEDLLWIKLDNFDDRRDHIVHMHSMQIFPVGWCESNHYPLRPPRDYVEVCKKLQKPAREVERKATIDIPISEPRSSLWCPKIYFNYRCFTGPMISKGKLATLPKAVGPGPVILVMREVLSMIVSVGYRSARILKVLQCDSKPDPGYHLEVLKAKHKNNVYRANVAVITSGDMVPEFCRSICKKLMVCPNLFGPLHVPEDDCPDKCHKAAKNKFTSVVSSTSKRGKPPYTSILVQRRAWGGRRKRRRGRWANREREIVNNYERDDDMAYLSLDLAKNVSESPEEILEDRQPLSEIDIMIQKGIEKTEKQDDLKGELPSSNNVSDDSRSSFNDRKSKDSNVGSPGTLNSKGISGKFNQNGNLITRAGKRDREWDTSIESDCSDADAEYVKLQKKQRRPKTRKLDSNPLFWTVDDVFRYLRKTNDCKDIAYRVKQEEIDGLAFLLLNLPSLTEHMKLRTSLAMKLCRHVEQVKVTFFLRHINEVEPEQYQIV